MFSQGEKWHLNLETDLSELENRELLEAVRKWEESEMAGTKVQSILSLFTLEGHRTHGETCFQAERPLAEKKRLAPLHDGGPTQLLNLQIEKLEQENLALRQRMKAVGVMVS